MLLCLTWTSGRDAVGREVLRHVLLRIEDGRSIYMDTEPIVLARVEEPGIHRTMATRPPWTSCHPILHEALPGKMPWAVDSDTAACCSYHDPVPMVHRLDRGRRAPSGKGKQDPRATEMQMMVK